MLRPHSHHAMITGQLVEEHLLVDIMSLILSPLYIMWATLWITYHLSTFLFTCC